MHVLGYCRLFSFWQKGFWLLSIGQMLSPEALWVWTWHSDTSPLYLKTAWGSANTFWSLSLWRPIFLSIDLFSNGMLIHIKCWLTIGYFPHSNPDTKQLIIGIFQRMAVSWFTLAKILMYLVSRFSFLMNALRPFDQILNKTFVVVVPMSISYH